MEDEQTQKIVIRNWSLIKPFQMISISLLSLLIPFSFLFISRLSLSNSSSPITIPGVFSILLNADIVILYTILSLLVVATLLNNLCGKPERFLLYSRLYICWIVLFAVQACVFGIKGRIATDLYKNPEKNLLLVTQERWVLIRVLFFLGLHEVMLAWFRVVVKPVVDDTVFGGFVEEEKWSERVVVALTFGLMWWWRLRDEVEGLAKGNLLIGLDGLDIVNWWIYYMCVGIGLVKIFKGFLYFGDNLFILTIYRLRKGFESCVNVDDHV